MDGQITATTEINQSKSVKDFPEIKSSPGKQTVTAGPDSRNRHTDIVRGLTVRLRDLGGLEE